MVRRQGTLQLLLILACLLNGSLAGGDIYRYIIEVPAWRNLNIRVWAEYSRHADLGNGLFLFPVEAIGGAIPLLIASVILFTGSSIFRPAAWSVHAATAFALVGLIFTFFAAPIMLNLPAAGDNATLIQQAFDKFHFWGLLRAIAQTLSFFFCVLAVGKLCKVNPA